MPKLCYGPGSHSCTMQYIYYIGWYRAGPQNRFVYSKMSMGRGGWCIILKQLLIRYLSLVLVTNDVTVLTASAKLQKLFSCENYNDALWTFLRKG